MTNYNPEEVTITKAELEEIRELLKDFPDIQATLDLIEESDGNLIDAIEKYAERHPEEIEKLFVDLDVYAAKKQKEESLQ